MLGTLSIAAGTASRWLLPARLPAHALLVLRARGRGHARTGRGRAAPQLLAAVAPQVGIRPSPSTIDALAASGDIDAGLLPARAAGPTPAATTRRSPARPLASPHTSPPASRHRNVARGRRRGVSSLAIAASDHPPASCRSPPRRPRRLLRTGILPDAGGRRDGGGMASPGPSAPAMRRVGGEWETATPSCSDACSAPPPKRRPC
ncbi:MAG: hypothetical protein ACLT98_00765 [Eggerthellaceae bacterium]